MLGNGALSGRRKRPAANLTYPRPPPRSRAGCPQTWGAAGAGTVVTATGPTKEAGRTGPQGTTSTARKNWASGRSALNSRTGTSLVLAVNSPTVVQAAKSADCSTR